MIGVAEVPPVRLTVYTRLPPSATVGVPLMETTRGGAMSVMVVETLPTAIVALAGADKLTVKISELSNTVSGKIGTLMVLLVSPAAKVKVPVCPVKSAPAVAVPLAVL